MNVSDLREILQYVPRFRGRTFVVAVDGAVSDAAIFQILDEVRGEEALSDSPFAVDDEVDLFAHMVVR